ncbi:hypothetical protein IQ230_06010 [Gloeocapsopsis crepidinum LEGE 06123]|uniref:Uncharacterized protein n=1 Tax=Gloeocapsopsis crepidinum LEGE 06123 TaxID=588587 RepID=A0ABR9UNQ6_9CHRO|nr:hypothetical protein [Gloeocapsopsis crepidinum]MBE9189922.1 hypothetical protein [Gloeocapsopsis crepidinum LEGE 06123]
MSQIYYLIRSRADGRYLVAHPRVTSSAENGYLLMFREDFDALSYLNTHGADVANQFAVESVAESQIGSLLQRWGFFGVGIVQDPLLPRVEFLTNF